MTPRAAGTQRDPSFRTPIDENKQFILEPGVPSDTYNHSKASSPSGTAQERGSDHAGYESSKQNVDYVEYLRAALLQAPSVLRRRCTKEGLSSSGSKSELAERLASHKAFTFEVQARR